MTALAAPSPASSSSIGSQLWSPRWRFGPPVLAFGAGWVALISWSGMVSDPRRYLAPTFAVGLVVVIVGIGLRGLRLPAALVAGAQLVLALLGVNIVVAHALSYAGVLPTVSSVRSVVVAVLNGAATLNVYAAPVSINPRSTQAMLIACGLGVLLCIELLTTWLRRLPLVALPLLVTLSVPVSILKDSLDVPVFVGTALLFLRLLATEQLDRFRRRGDTVVPVRALSGVLWQVSSVAVVVALISAPLVPVTDLLHRGAQPGPGGGNAGGYQLTVVNPFIRLRRDLVEKTHTPLVYARTDAASTSYLRTTVLDEFTADEWRPSPRDLPGGNTANGLFPEPPGLDAGVDGTTDRWRLQLAPNFATTWLPTPYPLRSLDVAGGWRYDSRTLDVAFVGSGAPSELAYSAVAFGPRITADLLDSRLSPPAKVRRPNTEVPEQLPAVIKTRAEEVTRGAKTNYEKAVALQNWFREGGGFRYSTDQRSGSGMSLLADFVTTDRVGYCEQFASAMAAMGRVLGIPSRVVVGFLDGTVQSDGRILYTSDDRHAWPEMYFTGVGWVRFEPTPGERAGATPPWTQRDRATSQPSSAPTPGASRAPAPDRNLAKADVSPSDSTGFSVPWLLLVGLLLAVGAGLAPSTLRRVQRSRRLGGRDPVELSEGAWAELRATALDLGLEWPQSRSPREQARSVLTQVHAAPEQVAALEGLLGQVERGRYARSGAFPADPETRSRTLATVTSWRRVLLGGVQGTRRWRGRIWPLSVLRRSSH